MCVCRSVSERSIVVEKLMKAGVKSQESSHYKGAVRGQQPVNYTGLCVWELQSAHDSSLTEGDLTANPNHSATFTPLVPEHPGAPQQQGQTGRQRKGRWGAGCKVSMQILYRETQHSGVWQIIMSLT